MSSFSSSVKAYLCEKSLVELGFGENGREKWKECCRRSFLRSVFYYLAKREGEREVLSSDREAFLEVIAFLLIRTFDLEAQVLPRRRGNRRGAELAVPLGTRERILSETASWGDSGCERCRILYIRAAFLSHGTILDPEKGYHAAFSVSDPAGAAELVRILEGFDVFPKTTETKEGRLVYLKESSAVEDLLSVMGAQRFSLDLMNKRIDKNVRGNINRRLNFDGANMKKAVNSSQNTITAIRYLMETDLFEALSDGLKQAAKLRLSYPEVSLAELVEHSEERITKSGLNHRLKKLCDLAEKMKNEEENI